MNQPIQQPQRKIRASSLDSIMICPRRQIAMTIPAEETKIPPSDNSTNWNSIIGTVVHEFALQPQTAPPTITEAINKQIEHAQTYNREIHATNTTKSKEDAEEQVKRCLAVLNAAPEYHELDVSLASMANIEHSMTNENSPERNPNEPILTGHCDYYHPEQGLLMDIKCSARSSSPNPVAQMGAYLYLLSLEGKHPKRVETWFIEIGGLSTSATKKKLIIHKHNIDDCITQFRTQKWFMRSMISTWEQTGDLNRIPAMSTSWACSKKFCPIYQTPFCTSHLTVPQ